MAHEGARQVVNELRGLGLSNRAIAEAIGRNDSMISQIARGARGEGYGAGLQASLAQLRAEVSARGEAGTPARQAVREASVSGPARRVRLTGEPARVRRPTTVRGGSFATSRTGRQASRHGAHGMQHPLRDAGRAGRRASVDVSVTKAVTVQGSSGKRAGISGAGGSFTMNLGDAEEAAERLAEYGGDFSAMVLGEAMESGLISVSGDASAELVRSIELRTY